MHDARRSSGRRKRSQTGVRAVVCLLLVCSLDDASARAREVDGAAGKSGALPIAEAGVVASDLGTSPAAAPMAAQTGNWREALPISVMITVGVLLVFSAFFSACETAFLSLPKPRLRALREEKRLTARLVVRMLEHPGRLLTTILVGNMLVNILIGILLGTRVADLLLRFYTFPRELAYVAAVVVCTAILLFFGEILPKIFAVRTRETYARVAVIPLIAADRVLSPVRNGLLRFTDFLFRVTRFHELRAAPYITDEELKSALSVPEVNETIAEEERKIIRRILEFRDVLLREILVPRPDVIALPEDATVGMALAGFREHEYSRMPLYGENLDNVTGVLFVKDLLPALSKGELDKPVKAFARPPHFVPETMSVQAFVKDAQRVHTHLAIVVDEYGGTEGIVTLQDAIEEVVGDIRDEGDQEEALYRELSPGTYQVEGNLPLDELRELLGIAFEDEEHETVAGYFMNQTDKVPEVGDGFEQGDVRFTVEAVEGKRASRLRIEVLGQNARPIVPEGGERGSG